MHEAVPAFLGGPARGRYILEAVLGSGAMGIVHRAHDTVLGRTVAVKTIRKEVVAERGAYRTYRSRFFHEARIVGSLSHPGIVTLYDMGETERGVPYLVMEYVPGTPLPGPGSRRKRFSLDESMWLLAQLASALDYAHRQDVIHRDIKPSNVLVRKGGEATVTDFGVAKMLGAEFTRSQTLFGTPGYMSPEQVLGKNLTTRTDIFSLGVVAFQLLSGERPFPGKSVSSVLYALVHTDPIFPSSLETLGLDSAKWREVFGIALAKDPRARYATASQMVSELVELFPGSWLGHLVSEDTRKENAEVGSADEEPPQATLTLPTSGARTKGKPKLSY